MSDVFEDTYFYNKYIYFSTAAAWRFNSEK